MIWKDLTTDMAVSITQGWRETEQPEHHRTPLPIAGQRYEKGLGTHAPGEMVFKLDRQHKQFVADVGVDDEGGARVGRVQGFARRQAGVRQRPDEVRAGGEAHRAGRDRGCGTAAGRHRRRRRPGGDHADWANAAVDNIIAAKPVPQFSTAGFFAVPNSPRAVLNFNPGWRFLKGDAGGAERPDFDDSAWEAANLPHSLEILGENASGCRNYQGPAWYRKRFQVAAPDAGGRVFVYFEAVMGKCAVWVNGQQVAEHFGGYLPFAAEITDRIPPAARTMSSPCARTTPTIRPIRPASRRAISTSPISAAFIAMSYLIARRPGACHAAGIEPDGGRRRRVRGREGRQRQRRLARSPHGDRQ